MEPSQQIHEDASTDLRRSGFPGKRWVAITLVALCVLISWVGVIDDKTEKYVDGAISQAIVAYAGARTLNAVISLLQSGEVGGGVVLEMSIHPFEALDPIDDMVEDYATVMKYAIGSLMIQKLLVEILSTNSFKWLITGSAILLIASLLFFNGLYASPLLKSFFFVALVRFLFVVTIFACGLVDYAFVNEQTKNEMNNVDITVSKVAQLEGDNPEISSVEKERINSEIYALEASREALNKRIDSQREEVAFAETQLDDKKNALEDVEKDMSPLQKYNPFLTPNGNYSEAKEDKEKAATKLKEQKNAQNDLERQLETVEASLAEQHKELVEEKGVVETAKAKLTTLKDMASYSSVKQTVAASIESMLKLIALFVFKTLLMPLAFLLLILRAFKLIWGIDPRSLARERYAEIKGD